MCKEKGKDLLCPSEHDLQYLPHVAHFINTATYMAAIYKLLERQGEKEIIKDFSEHTAFQAGLLHDIGKCSVPLEILNKRSSLTPEEWRVMKRHPVNGYDWLSRKEISENLLCAWPNLDMENVLKAALYHHEWVNGKGYPYGLQMDQIPTIARLCAVADMYDAITLDRPYRKGQPVEKALRVMHDVSGTQLDPVIVRTALSNPEWVKEKVEMDKWNALQHFIIRLWQWENGYG